MAGPSVVTRADVRSAEEPEPSTVPARGWRRYRPRTFWLFISPWIAGFLLLTAMPMAYALWMSFTNYDGITPPRVTGLANYARALADPQMYRSLLQTILLMMVVVPLTTALGLALAVACNQPLRGRSALRAIVYLPSVIPVVAGSLAFRLVFDHDSGIVNGLLDLVGLPPAQWLAGGRAFLVLVSFMLWGVGASMVLSLSALQGVPSELAEAGMIDGAGPWRRFLHITMPLISPILLFQIVTGVIASFQMFVPAFLLSAGTTASGALPQIPSGLQVFMIYVYQQYFGYADFGYASALLWLLFIVVVVFTAVVFGSSRSMVFYVTNDADEAVKK